MKILTFFFPSLISGYWILQKSLLFHFSFPWYFTSNKKADCDVQGIKVIIQNL
jgi:hypothetical protein